MSRKKKRAEKAEAKLSLSITAPEKRGGFRKRHLVALALILLAGFAGYGNTFSVPFHFDDRPNILNNSSVHISAFTLNRLEHLVRSIYPLTLRIFAYFSFALNYYFGGLEVFGYHLVNFLIHIASGLFLYGLLFLTLNLPSLKERYGSIAFPVALFSSLLFISHPAQTQSVTYIVQRMASMAGMFYLLAMLLYVKGRLSRGRSRSLYWAGTFLCYLLGLFTKENVAILPLFVALYEFYFFQSLELSPERKRILFYVVGSVVFIGFLMLLVWGRRYHDVIIEGYRMRNFTLAERVLTQFRVVLYYITLLIYPHPSRLNLDYDFPTSRGILDPPTTLLAILIVVGLFVYSLRVAKKRPLVSYFILWYFGNLLIESSIFPLEMVFEHRLYLPAVGPFVLFALLVVRGWEAVKKRVEASGASLLKRDFPLWMVFFIVTGLLCLGSHQRNRVWNNPIALWEDCVRKSPNKPRAHLGLGFYLVQDKQFEKGMGHFKTAITLDPRFSDAHLNLGLAYGEMNLFDQATSHFKEYLRLSPKEPEGYNELGLIYLQKNDVEDAIRYFKNGLKVRPDVAILHANLGNAYLQSGRFDEAISEYQRALRLDPNLTTLHVKLAEVYQKKGRPDQAIEEMTKGLKTDPSLAEAHTTLGASHIQEGRIEEGIAELKEALKFDAKDPNIYNNLGIAYRKKGLTDEAIKNYRMAISLAPSLPEPRINLGEAYLNAGRVGEATSALQDAIRLDPNQAEAHNNLGAIYLQEKKFDEAIASLKRAVAINPKYGSAFFNLAVAYYYKKDTSSASTYARKALDLGYEVDPRLLKALRIRP